MKASIEWHQEGLKNMKVYLDNKKQELDRVQNRLKQEISDLEKDIAFREYQINTAIQMNKDGFDADRFLINKNNA
jgi:hypothetical protein